MANPFDKFLTREQHEHSSLCEWLSWQHKDLFWWHTPNEGKKTAYERYLSAKMGTLKGVSDFIIMEPRGQYRGLVIELKAPDVKVYKKDKTCYFPEQEDFLFKMTQRGFLATFCCGFDASKKVITEYLK